MYSDDEEEDQFQGLTPAEAFRRAKIDHFLQHAREYVDMGRYLVALKTLDTVFTLDSANVDGKDLKNQIESTVTRLLHRRENGNGAQPSEERQAGRSRRSDLVLIVDQDERLLTSLGATLRKYGFLAVGASSYEEAVETFTVTRPEVVISEVNFESGPKGFDLYLWLKTNSGSDDLPFLFLATRIDRDTLIAGKRFGVDDLILKPVDDDVVIASVINCLSRRKTLAVHPQK
ncbi:MAG TPA: response regulator [Bacteroidota bacterium]|nr:response regulator [Bacteroidota bacterium]